MNTFWIISSFLTLTIFVVFLYLFFEKLKNTKFIFKRNNNVVGFDILEGLLFGALAIIFQISLFFLKSSFQPWSFVVIAVMLVLIKNTLITSIAVTMSSILCAILFPIDFTMLYMIVEAYFFIFFTKSFSLWNKNIKNILFSSLTVFVLSGAMILVKNSDLIIGEVNFDYITLTVFPWLIGYALTIVIVFLLNFFIAAKLLERIIYYDVENFFKPYMADISILDSINKEKIQYGIYGLFNIVILNKNTKNLEEIKNAILKIIQDKLWKKTILFKSDDNNYGFFRKFKEPINIKEAIENNHIAKRTETDFLYNVNKRLESICSKPIVINNKKYKFEIYVGASIYGIQDTSIAQLKLNAQFALNNFSFSEDNRILLFEPSYAKKKLLESKKVETIHRLVDLTNILNEYFPILDVSNNKTAFVIVGHKESNFSNYNIKEIKNQIQKMNLEETLSRYLAFQAIQIYDLDVPIVVGYHSNILNSPSFMPFSFLRTIKMRLGSVKKMIVLLENLESKHFKKNSLYLNNIDFLSKKGITYALNYSEIKHDALNIIDRIKPSYLFMNNNDLTTKIKDICKTMNIKIVFNKISTFNELEASKNAKINFIGGTFFNKNELKPLLFT